MCVPELLFICDCKGVAFTQSAISRSSCENPKSHERISSSCEALRPEWRQKMCRKKATCHGEYSGETTQGPCGLRVWIFLQYHCMCMHAWSPSASPASCCRTTEKTPTEKEYSHQPVVAFCCWRKSSLDDVGTFEFHRSKGEVHSLQMP